MQPSVYVQGTGQELLKPPVPTTLRSAPLYGCQKFYDSRNYYTTHVETLIGLWVGTH